MGVYCQTGPAPISPSSALRRAVTVSCFSALPAGFGSLKASEDSWTVPQEKGTEKEVTTPYLSSRIQLDVSSSLPSQSPSSVSAVSSSNVGVELCGHFFGVSELWSCLLSTTMSHFYQGKNTQFSHDGTYPTFYRLREAPTTIPINLGCVLTSCLNPDSSLNKTIQTLKLSEAHWQLSECWSPQVRDDWGCGTFVAHIGVIWTFSMLGLSS